MRISEIIPLGEDVWHGSPHSFKKFSLDRMNSGEGRQEFGWGLYFADMREVAEHYKRTLSPYTYDGKSIRRNQKLHWAIYCLVYNEGNKEDAKRADSHIASLIDSLDYSKIGFRGKIYNAEIPDSNDYLLWDSPMSGQSPVVRNAILHIVQNDLEEPDVENADGWARHFVQEKKDTYDAFQRRDFGDLTGGKIYRGLESLMGSDREVSLALARHGVPGIRYHANGGKAATQFNYVIFDDSLVTIKSVE